MQAKPWADNNDTSSGVIHSLSEKIFTKAALLAFDHVSKALQWPITRGKNRPLATVVVK